MLLVYPMAWALACAHKHIHINTPVESWRREVVLQWVYYFSSLCDQTLPFPLIQLNKFWTRSGSILLQTSMPMPLCTILRTRTLSQMGTWRRSPGLQVELSRISSCIVAWRERPPKILYCKFVTSWLVVAAIQEWIKWGRRWRVHWRQVDVVCERASGIRTLCLCSVVGVFFFACRWVRSNWCNNYHRFTGWFSKHLSQSLNTALVYECSLLFNRKTRNISTNFVVQYSS